MASFFSRIGVKGGRVRPVHLAAAACLVLALAASGVVAEGPAKAKDPLNLKTTAFMVEQTQKDGKQVEVLKPLPKGILPGTLIQYNITGKNEGKVELKDLRTEAKVPPETRYVDKSAKCDNAGGMQFTFDNGKTWAGPPLTKTITTPEGQKKTVTVPPEEYNGVRFVVKTLKAGASFTGIYRVILK